MACDAGLSLNEPLTIEAFAVAIAQVQAANPTLRATQSDRLLRVISYLRSRGVLDAVVYRETHYISSEEAACDGSVDCVDTPCPVSTLASWK